MRTERNNAAEPTAEIAVASHRAAEIEYCMTTAPNSAPKNSAATDATLLANLGLSPFASEESAPMPVIVSARTVVVRYRQAWKKLVVRLLIVVQIVGLLFGMGEISRQRAGL